MRKSIVFLLFLIALACNDVEDCQLDPYEDFLGINFNLLDPEDDRLIIFDEIIIDDLGNFSGDTINSTLFLPIDIGAESTTYRFVTDTATFFFIVGYNKQASIFERDCDITEIFSDLNIRVSNFDSIRVNSPILNKNNLNNIEIYF
jgi:hypothetical protein